ncbi:MAG: DUF6398 domain-containing protein [Methanoregula sp.]|nr:DUF6398 domain-containing protein [Methanoregula sp.]
MPRPKKTDIAKQSGQPIEGMPDDMIPAASSREAGREKKDSPGTGIPRMDAGKTEPEPSHGPGGSVPMKEIVFSAPIPVAIRPQFEEIGEIIRTVCKENINEEYYILGLLLLEKLARKRPSPILAGKAQAWAAGVLYALGSINFLFDKKTTPYINQNDLAEACGVKKATASGKGKLIRDMFKLSYWDNRFSTRSMQERNPLANLGMTKNGFIVDLRSLMFR